MPLKLRLISKCARNPISQLLSIMSFLSNSILPSSEFMSNQLYEILHCFNSKFKYLTKLLTFFPLILVFQRQSCCLFRPSSTFNDDLSEDCIKWWSFNIQFRYVKVYLRNISFSKQTLTQRQCHGAIIHVPHTCLFGYD